MISLTDQATRAFFAYALIIFLAIGAAAIVGWRRHHSRERVEARRRKRASRH